MNSSFQMINAVYDKYAKYYALYTDTLYTGTKNNTIIYITVSFKSIHFHTVSGKFSTYQNFRFPTSVPSQSSCPLISTTLYLDLSSLPALHLLTAF